MTLEEARKRYPPIWTIYDMPRDYPRDYVVRRWYGLVSEPNVFVTQSLQAAREHCKQQGADFCLLRKSADDPCIVESWI